MPRRQMTLRGLDALLFERAGLQSAGARRWRANATRACCANSAGGGQEIMVKGVPLAERLYVPEPFSESGKADAASVGAKTGRAPS